MEFAFVETTAFTRRIREEGLEDELRVLQQELLRNPEKGLLDPGTGGLRKVRMRVGSTGKGKGSGARVHYLYLAGDRLIYLIFVYLKGEQATLTAEQKKQLRSVAEAFKRER
ncbi:MAG TPA: type II toxin-antitoxin system RelE/ParE family toxin [Gemmatimonadales bacterium]|nr:type II toxin-antitoxin system RelE/ParE family toxin [Gemmatimonadales bacterium]